MTRDLSVMMRGMLLQNGIQLDDPAPPRRTTAPTASQVAAVDRDEVRTVLVAAGANESDLAWLVPSCPSVELARTWRPLGYVATDDMTPEREEQPVEEPPPVAAAAPTPAVGFPKVQKGFPKVQR